MQLTEKARSPRRPRTCTGCRQRSLTPCGNWRKRWGWISSIAAATVPSKTLVITPVITEIKFINGAARFWAGAFAGSSAAIMKVQIVEKETGRTIAAPIFYARAAAMGGAWTFGATDNLMLTRIAGRLTDYLANNYGAAVGGPTGQDPEKK